MGRSRRLMFVDWEVPAGTPKLVGGEVQVWRIDLESEDERRPETEYLSTLSPEEVERAGRLRAGQVRQQFLVGRSRLRELLAAELGIAPRQIPIRVTSYGKPEVHLEEGRRVYFNVTHARSTVLIALSLEGPVGIDIEYLDRGTDVLEVARHSLTDRERSKLSAINYVEDRNRAFFHTWTRKEAIVKADGRGLSLPLTSFEVPMGPECSAVPVDVPGEGNAPDCRYLVSDIDYGEEVACAVAVAAAEFRLRFLSFSRPR